VDSKRGLLYFVAGAKSNDAATLVGIPMGSPKAPVVFHTLASIPGTDIDDLAYSAPLDEFVGSAFNMSTGIGSIWRTPASGAGGKEWESWKQRGIVALSVEDIDLSGFESKADIRDALVDLRDSTQSPVHDAMACWDFLHVMQPGDEVFAKEGLTSVVGYGRVTGDYRFVSQQGYCHERDVTWVSAQRATLPETSKQFPRKTLTEITDDATAIETLRALFGLSDDGASAVEPITAARTFLFTWNPERWDWPELEASAAALASCSVPCCTVVGPEYVLVDASVCTPEPIFTSESTPAALPIAPEKVAEASPSPTVSVGVPLSPSTLPEPDRPLIVSLKPPSLKLPSTLTLPLPVPLGT
jgi:hypothetical protein